MIDNIDILPIGEAAPISKEFKAHILPNSGNTDTFSTGSVRDDSTHKLPWSLVSPYALRDMAFRDIDNPISEAMACVAQYQIDLDPECLITALTALTRHSSPAPLVTRCKDGLAHYGARNWELGQNMARTVDSFYRHAFAELDPDPNKEDHIGAMMWNIMSLVHHHYEVRNGGLPPELDDLPRYGGE